MHDWVPVFAQVGGGGVVGDGSWRGLLRVVLRVLGYGRGPQAIRDYRSAPASRDVVYEPNTRILELLKVDATTRR
jgi:hypothetical protein